MGDPSVDARKRFPLQVEAIVDGVCLTQNVICHAVAVVDTVALVKHVLGLGGLGVVLSVFIDVGADVGEKVGPVASLLECGAKAREVSLVAGEFLTEE